MAIYEAWLPMLADSTRQRLPQTAASIFADDLKRPNRQNSLLAQRESTRIAQRLGSRARGLSPTGLECSWCWQCWSMVEKPWGDLLQNDRVVAPFKGEGRLGQRRGPSTRFREGMESTPVMGNP